jgi:hypothetical protein
MNKTRILTKSAAQPTLERHIQKTSARHRGLPQHSDTEDLQHSGAASEREGLHSNRNNNVTPYYFIAPPRSFPSLCPDPGTEHDIRNWDGTRHTELNGKTNPKARAEAQ